MVGLGTIFLQQEVSRDTDKRLSAQWTLGLYRNFFESPIGLQIDSFAIDYQQRLDENTRDLEKNPYFKKDLYATLTFLEFYNKDKTELRKMGIALLQLGEVLYRCGDFSDKVKNKLKAARFPFWKISPLEPDKTTICDMESLETILLRRFGNYFFYLRPMIYCDRFFRGYFGKGNRVSDIGMDSEVYKTEIVAKHYLEYSSREDFGGEYSVFHTWQELRNAKNIERTKTWVVRDFRCSRDFFWNLFY